MVTVHITNEGIKILDGEYRRKKLRVNYAGFFPISKDAPSEGDTMNIQALRETFLTIPASVKRTLKNIRLIVGSQNYPTNKMEIPKMPEEKILKYVEAELKSRVTSDENMLYDYMDLGNKNKGKLILAVAMSKAYIDSYIVLLRSIGISVASVDFTIATTIKLAMVSITPRKETCIMVSLKKNHIAVYLFVKGEYYYLTSRKAASERGTPGFYDEVNSAISTTLQYSYAETEGEPPDRVYFISLKEKELQNFEILAPIFDQAISVPVEKLTPANTGITVKSKMPFELSFYAHNVGALI